MLIEESITRTINIDKKSTDEWQRWVADRRFGRRRPHDAHGRRRAETGSRALSVLRAQAVKPGKIYMSSWDWLETMYRQETGSRLSGRTQGLGVGLQRLRGRPAEWQRKDDRAGTPFTNDWLVDDAGKLLVRSELRTRERRYFEILLQGWKRLASAVQAATDCDELKLHSFTKDKSAVLAVGRACGDDRKQGVVDSTRRHADRLVFEDPEFEVDGVHTGPVRRLHCSASRSAARAATRAGSIRRPRGRLRALHKSFARAGSRRASAARQTDSA